MMDKNTYGIYNGEVYRIGIGRNNEIFLYYKQDNEKDHISLSRANLIAHSQIIKPEELSEAYYMLPCAEYKGCKTFIAGEAGDEYELWVSDYAVAQKLGFDRCDKYAYNMMVKKSDVKIFYEKKPIKL